jgi:hypothetical protein
MSVSVLHRFASVKDDFYLSRRRGTRTPIKLGLGQPRLHLRQAPMVVVLRERFELSLNRF